MYELLSIIPSPFTEKDLPSIFEKITKIIEELAGKIIKSENLGNFKLAYPIKHIQRGFYFLIHFELEGDPLKELTEKLKLLPEVLRFLITNVPKEIKRPKKEKIKKEASLEELEEKIDKLLKI